MTAEQRESASRAYERIADNLVGNEAEIARLYNLERAKFLRGEIDSIAENIPEFRKERGL